LLHGQLRYAKRPRPAETTAWSDERGWKNEQRRLQLRLRARLEFLAASSMLEGGSGIVRWLFAELDGGTPTRTTTAGLSDISPLARPLLSARNGRGEIERAFIDIPLYT